MPQPSNFTNILSNKKAEKTNELLNQKDSSIFHNEKIAKQLF